MTVHWGDDLSYPFTKNIDGSYTPPTGIHDKLAANGSPITSFDLTTKDQVKHHFTNPNGTGWYVATIADRNGNTVTVNHNTSDFVTSVVDPTGRTISLTYTGGLITSISDPLSRSWSNSYTSGNLTQVTWPSVGGSSYNEQFGYNAAHDITSHTDKRGHSFTATYNTDDSLASETDASSNTTSYSYSSGQTVITDGNSHTVKHNYTSGKLTRSPLPPGRGHTLHIRVGREEHLQPRQRESQPHGLLAAGEHERLARVGQSLLDVDQRPKTVAVDQRHPAHVHDDERLRRVKHLRERPAELAHR